MALSPHPTFLPPRGSEERGQKGGFRGEEIEESREEDRGDGGGKKQTQEESEGRQQREGSKSKNTQEKRKKDID